MRRALTLGGLGLVLAALGALFAVPAPAQQLPQFTLCQQTSAGTNPTLAACGAGAAPLAAAAFGDSVGVNIHLEYHNDTIWDTDYPTWSPTLLNSSVVHLRFGFCHYGTSEAWCPGTYAPRFNALAAAGKKMDILTDPWMGWTTGTSGCNGTNGCTSGYPAALGLTGSAIDAYEGPNECNNNGGNCTTYGTSATSYPWPPGVLNVWEPEIYTLLAPGVSIYGPPAAGCDASQFPNLSAYITTLALHDYPGSLEPENGTTTDCQTNSRIYMATGTTPSVTTESGYTTGPPYTDSDSPVDRLTQERYLPRMLMMRLNPAVNIRRTYLYELIDYPAGNCNGTTTAYSCYGLLDGSFNPKPAWTRLTQLLSYFADAGASPQAPLSYTLTGDTSNALWVDLFQRSNGNYVLVPWLATRLWDITNHVDLPITSENLTLTLPPSVTTLTVTQFNDNGAQVVTHPTCTAGVCTVPVTSLVEGIEFSTTAQPPSQPTLVQSASCGTVGNQTSVSCSLPTAPNSTGTNEILAFLTVGTSTTSITPPAGWSLVTDAFGGTCNLINTGNQAEYVYAHVVHVGDAAGPYTFTRGAADAAVEALAEVDNLSATTPVERCVGASGNGSTGPVTGAAMTSTVANDLPLVGYGPSTSGLGVTLASDWSGVTLYNNTQTPFASFSLQQAAALTAPGSITPSTTFTGSGGTIVFVPIVQMLLVPTGTTVPTPTPTPSPPCCTNAVQWPANFEPYSSASPRSYWNIPFPHPDVTPTLWPNSDAIVQHAIQTTDAQQLWATDVNLSNACGGGSCASDPGHPWYFATSSDPLINVTCLGTSGACGDTVATMRIPAKARPANVGGDRHIAVVQPDGTEIDTWATTYPSGDWGTTGNTTLTAQTVANCGNFYTGPGTTNDTNAATVGDACLMGGLVRENEAVTGPINHALFVTVQCGTRGSFVYPAFQQFDNACGDGQPSFYNGAHLWLDLTAAQINAMTGLPGTASDVAWQKNVLIAMHKYGMYILDSGGGASRAQQPNIFLEDSAPYTIANGANSSPWAQYGAANGWAVQTGGAFGTAHYWMFSGAWNPLISAGYSGGWPAHLHWVDPCYAHGTCG